MKIQNYVDYLPRLTKLHAILCISYGSLVIDLNDKCNAPCIPGDLKRLRDDAFNLANLANELLHGGHHK